MQVERPALSGFYGRLETCITYMCYSEKQIQEKFILVLQQIYVSALQNIKGLASLSLASAENGNSLTMRRMHRGRMRKLVRESSKNTDLQKDISRKEFATVFHRVLKGLGAANELVTPWYVPRSQE